MKKWLVVIFVACSMLISIGSTSKVESKEITSNKDVVKFEEASQSLSAAIGESKKRVGEVEADLTEIKERNRKTKELLAAKNTQQVVSRGGSRNYFLTLDLRTKFNLTPEDYDKMLKGTPLYGHGWIFAEAEKKHGVNGLFLMSLTGKEQSFGAANSGLKSKKNLTSLNANDGAVHEAYSFDSYWACIDETARQLKKNYLTKEGKYFGGYTLGGVNDRYASDTLWASGIARIMQERLAMLEK